MTIFKQEFKMGFLSLIIWTSIIAAMLMICIMIYPDMAKDMTDLSVMFSDMGSFSQAFGMDRINFGEFSGYFGIECGNVLGLGGAFFAALSGITALSREEKEHTAEFLLTHPVSRKRVLVEKLATVYVRILILNVFVSLVTAAGILLIGEKVSIRPLSLLLISFFLMQLEIASITFGVSAFIRNTAAGIGLSAAVLFYFLNLIANLSDDLHLLKAITPFGYTDSADIFSEGSINVSFVAVGVGLSIFALAAAFIYYPSKDIRA